MNNLNSEPGWKDRSCSPLLFTEFRILFTLYHAPIIAVIFNSIITPRHTRKPLRGNHSSPYRFVRYRKRASGEALLKVRRLNGGASFQDAYVNKESCGVSFLVLIRRRVFAGEARVGNESLGDLLNIFNVKKLNLLF